MWILDFWKSFMILAMLMVSGTYFTGFMMSRMVNFMPIRESE